MSPVLTIFRKELRSYVMTPYGWVILAFVMALQSVSLSGTLKAFQLAPQKEGILFFILHSPMFWFYFLFIFPLLTMRSLAEEEKTGTLESLLTTPIKTWQVVLGNTSPRTLLHHLVAAHAAIPPPGGLVQPDCTVDLRV